MHMKPFFVMYLPVNVMWFILRVKYLQGWCGVTLASQWPCWWHSTSSRSDNNANSHNATVWACHMAESQHTQTLPCVQMVWHRDGNSCQRGPPLLSKKNRHGTQNHMFLIYFLCQQPAAKWGMFLDWPVDGTVTSKLNLMLLYCCMKEAGKYSTIMGHVIVKSN